MTTYTWTSTTGGAWATAGDWSSSIVPTGTDVASISTLGSYTIQVLNTNTVSAVVMSDPGATLSFATGGTLTLAANGSFALNGGTVSVTGGSLAGPARGTLANTTSLTMSAGLLTVSAGSAAFGTGGIDLSGGTVSVTGGALNTTGLLAVSGGSFTEGSGGADSIDGADVTGGSVTIGGTITSSGNTAQFIVASTGSVTLSGGTISANGTFGGVLNNGTIEGHGALVTGTGTNDVEGNGTYIADGGVLSVGAVGMTGAPLTTSPNFRIDDHSTLVFGGTVSSKASVAFNGSASEILSLGAGAAADNFNATISNFVSGDTISVTGAQSFQQAGSVVTVYSGIGHTGSVLATLNFASNPGVISETGSNFTVCFAAGSRIRTEQGDVAVESLVEGQSVAVLRDGAIAYTPVTWIGERRINLTAHPQPQTAAPVRIRQGAIGENLPERDLLLSPDHCLFLDGKLVPAKALINGMTIVQERALPAVHYFHVEVDPHAVLLAEGLPVESYLDTGNRAYFQNAGAALVLHPEFTVNAGLKAWETDACAPLTVQPEAVQPMWQRLADRAATLGFAAPQFATTQDADLHLLADGRAIRPMAAGNGRYVFALPGACEQVRLVSRATIPSDLAAWVDDWRSIGVAVSRVVVRAQGAEQVIPADHPGLTSGWHRVESDGSTSWRWTDGNAELRLDAVEGPAIVEIQVCNTARYLLGTSERHGERLAA